MRTRLYRYRPWNLTTEEARQVSHLNYQGGGSLQGEYKDCLEYERDSWAYLLKEEGTDKILAWGLVWQATDLFPRFRTYWKAMFWTRLGYRGRGYGTRLVRKMQRDFERTEILVFPHSAESYALFRKTRRGNKRQYI